MKVTRIFELRTLEDVDRLCETLKTLKKLAPVSLRYTVAITADRKTEVKELSDGKRKRDPVERSLDRLSRDL